MEACARIRYDKASNGEQCETEIPLSPLQAAEVVANRYGFCDLDYEPMGDHVRLTATNSDGNVRLRVTAESEAKASEKLIRGLLK